MQSNSCQELLKIETISLAFRNNDDDLSVRIISCCYSCYQSQFVKWAQITYQRFPADLIEFIAYSAFTDGVLKLKEAASRGELYQSNASVKTILFHFCRNILLGALTNESRLAEKNIKIEQHFRNETDTSITDTGEKEIAIETILKALAKMAPADRQIIQWRHIEEKSNDEIAKLLDINVASATNRIYRCMQRLRELVENINKNNG